MKPKRVLIICGSKNDLPAVIPVCQDYNRNQLEISIDVISCHRNPLELMQFARELKDGEYDLIICVGSKAFALPGVLDAWLHFFKKTTRVAGIAIGTGDALWAAQLSIGEVPGGPLVFSDGNPANYTGDNGLRLALNA